MLVTGGKDGMVKYWDLDKYVYGLVLYYYSVCDASQQKVPYVTNSF